MPIAKLRHADSPCYRLFSQICCQQQMIVLLDGYYMYTTGPNLINMAPTLFKEPWNTSVLMGHAWVQELVNVHPLWINLCLGIGKEVLKCLGQETTCSLWI